MVAKNVMNKQMNEQMNTARWNLPLTGLAAATNFFSLLLLHSQEEGEKVPFGALFLVTTTEGVDFVFKCLGISDSQLHSLAGEPTNYLSHCYGMPHVLSCGARPKLYCQGDVKYRKRSWQGGRRRQSAQSCCWWAHRPVSDWFVFPDGQVGSCPTCPLRGWGRKLQGSVFRNQGEVKRVSVKEGISQTELKLFSFSPLILFIWYFSHEIIIIIIIVATH